METGIVDPWKGEGLGIWCLATCCESFGPGGDTNTR